MKRSLVHLHSRIFEEQDKKLEFIANETGYKKALLIRKAITEFLEREYMSSIARSKKKVREEIESLASN